jgi:hypothetical protein
LSVRGVVSGYVVDGRSSALRPVVGIPGSAYLGDAVALPWGITAGKAKANRDLAIVISNEQPAQVYILRGLSGTPSILSLDGALAGADRIALSADGGSAAIVDSVQGQIQFLTKLNGTPVVSQPVPIAIGAVITAVAISNSACAIVGAPGQLDAVSAANPGAMIPLYQQAAFNPAGIAWLDNQKLAVADSGQNQVLLFADATGTAPVILLDSSAGVNAPVGIVGIDSSTIALGNAGGLIVASTDSSAAARAFALPLPPSILAALDTPSILISNLPGDLPLLLIDVQQNFSAYFVPSN